MQGIEPDGMAERESLVFAGSESIKRMPHRQQERAGEEKEGHTGDSHVPNPAHAGMEQDYRDRHESAP